MKLNEIRRTMQTLPMVIHSQRWMAIIYLDMLEFVDTTIGKCYIFKSSIRSVFIFSFNQDRIEKNTFVLCKMTSMRWDAND